MVGSPRHLLAGALAVGLLAAGCATEPGSSAPPAGLPDTPSAAASSTPAAAPSTPAAASSTPTETDSAAPLLGSVVTEATACVVPDRLAGREVERLPVTDRLIALTFDAGANGDAVPSILATLRDRDVKATFFLTGSFVQTFPVKSARIARLHLVGNHTMDHVDLTTVTDLRIARQVRRAETAILATTGEDPRRFFRFPFGARDTHTITVVNGLCYVPFRWTVDTLGWKGTSGGMTAQKVVDRVVAAAQPGAIVLMHVGSNPDDGTMLDAEALPAVIRQLRLRGYTFVRLSRVLDAAP